MERKAGLVLGAMIGLSGVMALANAADPEVRARPPVMYPPVEKAPPPAHLLRTLPDLRPAKLRVEVFSGVALPIHVDVANSGLGNSAATNVAVTARVINAGNNTTFNTQPLQSQVPALAAGATRTVRVGEVVLPDRTEDWLITFVPVVVDPSPLGQTGGSVQESDESNNELRHRCLVLRPGADLADFVHLNASACKY